MGTPENVESKHAANPNVDIRDKFEAGKAQMTKTLSLVGGAVLNLGFWSVEIVSDFEIRDSNLVSR
jgi:hypothetical protein